MIKLDDKFELKSDGNQYILRVPKGVDKKGKAIYDNKGFYSTIEQALKAYVRYVTLDRAKDAQNLKDLLKEVIEIKKQIEEITKGEI